MTASGSLSAAPLRPHEAARRTRRLELDGSRKQALETGRTRLLVAGLLFACVFLVIALRIVDLAVLSGGAERQAAHRRSGEPAVRERADIVDRNGRVLATTLPAASLYANPHQVNDAAVAAARLSAALPGLGRDELVARLRADRSFVWLKRGLTPRQQYAVNRLGIPGLYFKREAQRVYPQGRLTAHVVGFTDVDSRGLAGLERAFDERLQHGDGPLRLTLDLRVQHLLSEELAAAMREFRAIGAAGVVMDATSGEVLALVSLPSFEPGAPGAAEPDARFNRASLGTYEMGSVFKIFTAAAALDSGAVGLRDDFDVSRPIRVARFTINDFKPKQGRLSVPEIFMYSSNIGTVHMAMEAGTEVQRAALSRLGLTRPAGIELPEVGTPLLPSPWREINTMTVAYGHGLAVSPVQLTAAVAATVNGGVLHRPTLVRPNTGESVGRRVLSEDTSRKMRWLMRLVVLRGTGGKANAEGFLVGGKTGTADKLKGGAYARDARIASFVGAFPMDEPRYVVFAMLDEPKGNESTFGYATGGWIAAPVVRRVVERMGPMLGLEPRVREAPGEDGDGLLLRVKAASGPGADDGTMQVAAN